LKIIWSDIARRKIDEIVDNISVDNVEAAIALVEEFESRVQDLQRHPLIMATTVL